jgi:hypothetical protein
MKALPIYLIYLSEVALLHGHCLLYTVQAFRLEAQLERLDALIVQHLPRP